MRYRFGATAVALASSFALLGGIFAAIGGHPGRAAPVQRAQAAKPPVFDDADLRNRDFTGADLDGASFRHAQLQGANFSRARLLGVMFEGAQLNDAKFVEAQLEGAQFSTANMDGVDFTGAQLQSADLGGQLHGLKLARANLRGVLFGFGVETELHGADLTGAVLTGADLAGAQLQGASLKSADLRGADLSDANLQGADLDQADLRGANLDRAQLQGASLRGAKLWHTLGEPETDLADLRAVDVRAATRLTRHEVDAIARLFQLREDARKRLSVLVPAIGTNAKKLTKAEVWKPADPSPKDLAELLAKMLCGWHKDAPDADPWFDNRVDVHVVRGLMRNGRLAAVGDQASIVVDALRKGRSDPAACAGAARFTEADWAALDAVARASVSAGPQPASPQ